jgi:predicted nucleic acid-binding protein
LNEIWSWQALYHWLVQLSLLAHQYIRSVYDALYVALALQEGCQLVTADGRLYNALRPVLPDTMLWVGDLPASA